MGRRRLRRLAAATMLVAGRFRGWPLEGRHVRNQKKGDVIRGAVLQHFTR